MAHGWERIYEQQGDLGFGVLPKIIRASKVFRDRGYSSILDLGCGTGRHSIFLAQCGFSVRGTDLSPTGIRIAQDKAESLNLGNVTFELHDMKAIPMPDQSCDAVICTWTIYHGTLAGIQQTLNEIHRVLRTGGSLVTDFLSTRDSTYRVGREIEHDTFVGQKPGEEDVPHHYSTRAELKQLLRPFSLVRIRLQSRTYAADGKEYARVYLDAEAVK